MKNLYKVKAHFGHKSCSTEYYYVVAESLTQAEEAVAEHHIIKKYPTVGYCHVETVAQAGEYGKPSVLLADS